MGPSRWSRGIADEATIHGILLRLDGKVTDSLASVGGFRETLKHCAQAANGIHDV
jgi:hypothetical protein